MNDITLYRVKNEFYTTLKEGESAYRNNQGYYDLDKVSFHKDSLRALCASLLNGSVVFNCVEKLMVCNGELPVTSDIVEIV